MTHRQVPDEPAAAPEVTRREFLGSTTAGLGVAAFSGRLAAPEPAASTSEGTATTPRRVGLLLPQRNEVRDLIDLSGLGEVGLLDLEDERDGTRSGA